VKHDEKNAEFDVAREAQQEPSFFVVLKHHQGTSSK